MTVSEHETPPSAASTRGRLQTWRARWFGERDEVADQLADIARQGSGMARLAHVCASLMLVLFSAGSLVALGGDALLGTCTDEPKPPNQQCALCASKRSPVNRLCTAEATSSMGCSVPTQASTHGGKQRIG